MTQPCITASSIRRQQGSIMVFAAIGISLAVILLSIADIGFLYFYKREYQKSADLAAMAGAKNLYSGCTAAQTAGISNAASNLGSRSYTPLIECGVWNSAATTMFTVGGSNQNAVRATITGAPPHFMMGARTLSASAIAITDQPIAALNIRSTVASVDTSKSAVLNSVVGGFLGGNINLDAASWQGLLNTNVNLLSYLDALALRTGVSAGNYSQVLATNTTAGNLLGAAVDALGGGSSAGASVNTLAGAVGASVSSLNLTAGSLIALQSGTPTSGLGLDMNALTLVQAIAQLANSQSAVAASVPLNLLGLSSGTVTLKVIQPPQISAIGNPAFAKLNPTGPNKIYVRNAQVRTLITQDLSGLTTTVTSLANTVLAAVSPVTSFLNSALSLNLVSGLTNLLSGLACPLLNACPTFQQTQVSALSNRIDINLDAGAGSAYVTDYLCANAGATKSLTVPATTSAAALRIGNLGTTSANPTGNVFSSSAAPTVTPVVLVNIYYVTFKPNSCTLGICSSAGTYKKGATWVATAAAADQTIIAAFTLKANTTIAAGSQTLTYAAPPATSLPNLNQDPYYQTITSQNVVNSISSTLSGATIQVYSSASNNVLGTLLVDSAGTLNALNTSLQSVVSGVLSPLLDPLVTNLLNDLGLNLAQTDVGARMTCNGGGATLVN